jgi:SAM-dependent methyltransferase
VDISQKAVDEANEALEKEASAVKEKVNFKKSDFLTYDAKKEQFDTITITEVLEHLVNPEDFIEKAKELLVDNGTLIVTVPFGINDFPDHKKTYYFLDLYQMIYKDFDLKDVSILGKWIGFIATKRFSTVTQIPRSISFQSLKTIEDAFYVTEREFVDTIKSNSQLLNDYRRDISNLKTELYVTKESLSYRLGHTLLHEKKKLINPLKIFQKIRTANKIRKERKNNAL